MKIKVLSSCCTTNLGGHNPNNKWSRNSTSSDWSVHGIEEVTSKNAYYDIETEFDLEKEVEYYLVYAVYTTGDSFGYDKHGSIEYIGIYKDSRIADENCARNQNHYKNQSDHSYTGEKTYQLKILLNNGG